MEHFIRNQYRTEAMSFLKETNSEILHMGADNQFNFLSIW